MKQTMVSLSVDNAEVQRRRGT